MTLGIEIVRDPAAPDDTAVFLAALATGRNVLVPKGDWYIAGGALPELQRGQRIVGESSTLSRLRFSSGGDGVVLCHRTVDNYRWCSGLEGVGVYSESTDPADTNTMGIRMTGGAFCTLRDVAVAGWAHHVVLDGHNSAEIDNLHLGGDQTPGKGHEYPLHGLWLADGDEVGKGWTIGGGTNGNHIRGLSVNQGGPCPVQVRGGGNSIRSFMSNAGAWNIGGNNNLIDDGTFEFATQSGPAFVIDGEGVAAFMPSFRNIHSGANTFLRLGPTSTVYSITMEDVQSHGPHIIECQNAVQIVGRAKVSGIHVDYLGTPARRAVSIEQIFCEIAFSEVFEQMRPYGEGRGSLGIGKLQPTGARLHVGSEGYVPKSVSFQWGAAPPGWEWP